jgi:hypothetical protein
MRKYMQASLRWFIKHEIWVERLIVFFYLPKKKKWIRTKAKQKNAFDTRWHYVRQDTRKRGKSQLKYLHTIHSRKDEVSTVQERRADHPCESCGASHQQVPHHPVPLRGPGYEPRARGGNDESDPGWARRKPHPERR